MQSVMKNVFIFQKRIPFFSVFHTLEAYATLSHSRPFFRSAALELHAKLAKLNKCRVLRNRKSEHACLLVQNRLVIT